MVGEYGPLTGDPEDSGLSHTGSTVLFLGVSWVTQLGALALCW